jgi:2-oxoglutarate ferredoxin oxidoreductase subunit delta
VKGAQRIDIDRKYCKCCMLCQYVCEFDVFEPGEMRSDLDYLMPRPARIENCRVCRLCELNCPDMALTVVAEKKEKKEKVNA